MNEELRAGAREEAAKCRRDAHRCWWLARFALAVAVLNIFIIPFAPWVLVPTISALVSIGMGMRLQWLHHAYLDLSYDFEMLAELYPD